MTTVTTGVVSNHMRPPGSTRMRPSPNHNHNHNHGG